MTATKIEAMQQVKIEIKTEEILKGLDEGLQPILKNLQVERLSDSDKKSILAKLEQLEHLALQIKQDLLNN